MKLIVSRSGLYLRIEGHSERWVSSKDEATVFASLAAVRQSARVQRLSKQSELAVEPAP